MSDPPLFYRISTQYMYEGMETCNKSLGPRIQACAVFRSERVFKPQDNVNYELNVDHFGYSATSENNREHYGTSTIFLMNL